MVTVKPSKGDFQYERVPIDEWVTGTIEEVQERTNDNKKYKDGDVWKTKSVEEVRFKFKLDGMEHPHYSRWMTASVHEKSTLFSKFLIKLIPNVQPQTEINLDGLVNTSVKTMWDEKDYNGNMFQFVANIKPLETTAAEEIF